MPEEYVVMVDGRDSATLVGRGQALGMAMDVIGSVGGFEVAVADARTFRLCAYWRRSGRLWNVRAIEGWLPQQGDRDGI